ncbi:MAG: PRC-barrel domain-containing protein [Methanobacterium sp.]
MKISDELKGKEVIDANGDKVGEISDVEWNPQMNKVESILVSEGTASKIGLGEKKVIAFEDIDAIGEKVLLKRSMPE